jgi:hypothetical protein
MPYVDLLPEFPGDPRAVGRAELPGDAEFGVQQCLAGIGYDVGLSAR